jgi:hypothetical protein
LSIQVQFQLYLLYKENGNLDREEYYKNLIISNYPDSDYAKLLLDPDYFKEMQKKHNYLRDLYEKTYSAYEKEQYTMVVYNADQALEIQREDELIPKFLYLKAISMAKTDIADSMIVNLEKLIDIYPNSEVRPMAENILTNLGVYNPDDNLTEEELAAKEQMEAALGMYTIDKDNEHFFIVFVDGTQINVNALKPEFLTTTGKTMLPRPQRNKLDICKSYSNDYSKQICKC